MNDNDGLKNWTPPEDPSDWDLRDKVMAEKAGLSHLVPGSYEWKMAYRGRFGEWPTIKPPTVEERLRHAEEMEAEANKQRGQQELNQARQDRYKARFMKRWKK